MSVPHPTTLHAPPAPWLGWARPAGVYILPGIPRLFQAMVAAHQARFTGVAARSTALLTALGEGDIAATLTPLAAQHAKVYIRPWHAGLLAPVTLS